MAKKNVVELMIDLQMEGKEDLAKYSKELKALSKMMTELDKKAKKQMKTTKEASDTQKAANKQTEEQLKINKQVQSSQNQLIKTNGKVVKSIKAQTDAQKKLNNSLKEIQDEADGASDSLGGIGGKGGASKLSKFGGIAGKTVGTIGALTSAALAAGTAISTIIVNSAKANREMENLARMSGSTRAEFESLAYATSQFGVSAEQISDQSKDLFEKLGDYISTGGGTFQDFADVLKLTKKEATDLAVEFQHMTSAQVLTRVVSEMEKAGASSAQMSLALEGLGSDLTKLLPLFRNNASGLKELQSAYDKMNATLALTEEQAKALTQTAASWDLMISSFEKGTAKISSELAPELDKMLKQMTTSITTLSKAFTDFLQSFRDIENQTNLDVLNDEWSETKKSINEANKELLKHQKILDKQKKGQGGPNYSAGQSIANVQNSQDKVNNLMKESLEIENRIKELNVEKARMNKQEIADEKKKQEAISNGSANGTKGDPIALEALKNSFKTEEQLLKDKYEKDQKLAKNNADLLLKIDEKYLKDKAALLAKKEEEKKEKSEIKETNDSKVLTDDEILEKSIQDSQTQLDNITLKINAEIGNKEELQAEAKTIQMKLEADIEKQDISEPEKENQKLKLQAEINRLLKIETEIEKESIDLVAEKLKDELELLKLSGDKITAINKEKELKDHLLNSDEYISEELKKQELIQNKLVANQKILNVEKSDNLKLEKETIAEKERQQKAEVDGLKYIQDLRWELQEAQGVDTSISKLESQRKQAKADINSNPLTSVDMKAQQSSLVDSIFDERVVDAKFEQLKAKYEQLLVDLSNATPDQEINILKDMEEAMKELSTMDGLDGNQLVELKQMTSELNNDLVNVGITAKNVADQLQSGFANALTGVLTGTMSIKDAFQNMAISILQNLIEIQVQAMTTQMMSSAMGAMGMGAAGAGASAAGAAGAGMMSMPFFHTEGSPSDPMIDTRPVKSLNADEMTAVVNKNEKVITKTHYNDLQANGGGGGKAPVVNNHLVLDPSDLQKSIGKTDEFSQNVISIISANNQQIKGIVY